MSHAVFLHAAGDARVAPFNLREGAPGETLIDVAAVGLCGSDLHYYKDGGIGSAHPRGAGTFPRVLGVYVRERGWLTLPEAIRKMTSLPAQRLGWQDRGTIREGAFADLVLFDPDTVIDRSTFAEPTQTPVGIEKVFVNGVAVWSDGKATGERPGRVLLK